jgi:hypothetical protein
MASRKNMRFGLIFFVWFFFPSLHWITSRLSIGKHFKCRRTHARIKILDLSLTRCDWKVIRYLERKTEDYFRVFRTSKNGVSALVQAKIDSMQWSLWLPRLESSVLAFQAVFWAEARTLHDLEQDRTITHSGEECIATRYIRLTVTIWQVLLLFRIDFHFFDLMRLFGPYTMFQLPFCVVRQMTI